MPYRKDPVPVGASMEALIRWIDGELVKLEQETTEHVAMIEALDIIGISATWLWDDVVLGEPPPGFMRADTNQLSTITAIHLNYQDAQGKNIQSLLNTSTIKTGDLVQLINVSGQGAGVYTVTAEPVFFTNHVEIPVGNFTGTTGNPLQDAVMGFQWEFATAPGLFAI